MMRILHHIINSILPYECPCCESDLIEPTARVCPKCGDYFHQSLKIQTLNMTHPGGFEPHRRMVDDRKFFFKSLYHLGTYEVHEKAIFQKAKFQDDAVMQSYIFSFLKTFALITQELGTSYIIPAPSSKPLIGNFTRRLAKHCQVRTVPVFKKTRNRENKTLDQFSRYREIQRNIILDPVKNIPFTSHDRVIIFDDLWTTGATMNHLCKLLVDCGIPAAQIQCLVLFIRPRNHIDL